MTTSSTNNSVFRGFFEKQKRTGPNFIDWYRQLRIVLSIEDKLNYLVQHIPHVPVAPAGQQVAPEILAAHSAWVKGSKEIAGLMLMTMKPEIQRNMEPLHVVGLTSMMTTSSTNNSVFRDFFEKQKLTGPNFIDWYRQLSIVLSIEDKLNYLEQHIPHVPVAPAGQQVALEILAAHSAWVKGSKEIAGLMIMTMEPEIQQNLEPLHVIGLTSLVRPKVFPTHGKFFPLVRPLSIFAHSSLVELNQVTWPDLGPKPIPHVPVAPAGQQVAPEILAAHSSWVKGSQEIAGLILMTMEPEIQRNLEPLHAHEMLKELKTLFSQQAEQELLHTTRDFHSCRQEEVQSVSSYVLQMKGYIDNLERLGHPVTLSVGVSLILIGLRKEYDGFVQNYNMHNMGKTVNELHAMLKLHEQTLPKSNAPALNAIRAEQLIPHVPVAPAGQQVAPEILAAHKPLHAYEMLKELKTLFAQQAEQELLQTTRDFHSCRQEEGQSVSSYVLKMKGYIDNLDRLGHPVALGVGVSLILIGLRKEYDGFVENYNIHSMRKTVNELHAMLKLHEQTLPKKQRFCS
nr:zinc finger, CCHC-type [Tanacetum cinerariifolium]